MTLFLRFRGVILALAATVILGAAGYRVVEGWDWLDSFFMTFITLTTVGYEEVHPLSPAGKILSMVVMVAGIGGVAYTFSAIAEYIVSGELRGDLERDRMHKRVGEMRNHFIICGFGRVGSEVARQFGREGVPFVVVDNSPDPTRRCAECGHPVVQGDATDDDVLREAGIANARGLVATLDNDAENTYVVLSARALRLDLFIVARSDSAGAEAKLKKAGANRVLSPYSIGGRHMAGMAVRPSVVDFLDDVMSSENLDCWVEEITVLGASSLKGGSLGSVRLRNVTGANVLAIRKPDRMVTNPADDTVVQDGDRLIAFGSREQLGKLTDLAAG